jgi:hypothetical protein
MATSSRWGDRAGVRPPYDATPFVAYFLGSIVKSAEYVLARIRGLGQIMVGIHGAIVERTPPPAMIDGLAYAWVNRHIRAGDYRRLTGRRAQTTTRELATPVPSLPTSGETPRRL